MATHFYKNDEIEVSTRDNGDFIEARAKFKPMHGYLGTFSMWGKFSNLEAAEQAVLEEAKRIIDNRANRVIFFATSNPAVGQQER